MTTYTDADARALAERVTADHAMDGAHAPPMQDCDGDCQAAARILSSPPAVVVSRDKLERLRDAFDRVESRGRVEALALELGADEDDMAGPTEDHHDLIAACREIAALLGADGEG